jgi:hypothetical protein
VELFNNYCILAIQTQNRIAKGVRASALFEMRLENLPRPSVLGKKG